MRVVHSSSRHAWENLAAEDLLLDDPGGAGPVLMISRNERAVVIGKNQNPWRECAVSRLAPLGVTLARRVSGGGTVYHDSGNLNFSLILPRDAYRRDEALAVFIRGLASIGIAAELAGGTSLAVQGRKISGNAFCYRRDKVLHHGTLLWRADLVALHAFLRPELPDVDTRAVASVPMPVVNAAELTDAGERDAVAAIVASCAEAWGPVVEADESPFAAPGFAERVARMGSWDWLYGTTPDFRCQREGATVLVHRGVVSEVGGSTTHHRVGQRFAG